MYETEREQSASRFLQSLRERGHSNTHRNEVVLLINNEGNILEPQQRDIHFHVIIDLPLREGRIAIKFVVGCVDKVENLFPVIARIYLGGFFEFKYPQVVFALHNVTDTLVFFGDTFGYLDFILDPIDRFLKPKSLDVIHVIRVVVYRGLRTQLVITLDEHTFGIHIGKSKRAVQCIHTFGASPIFYGTEKGFTHLFVVDKIDKAESSRLLTGLFVDFVVDDTGNTAHGIPIAISHIINRFAKIKSRIAFCTQCSHLVQNQCRHIVLVAVV